MAGLFPTYHASGDQSGDLPDHYPDALPGYGDNILLVHTGSLFFVGCLEFSPLVFKLLQFS